MTRKMKDSGIEWIGEIPEDWRVMSLKHSLKGLRTGINPRDNFQLGEGNNFYVTIKNFKDGKLFLDEKCDRITDEALEIINKRADLKVNDILFSSISDEGHIFLIKEKPKNWTINESVFSIRPNKKIIHPKFLSYILPKNYIFAELKSKETGSTFKSIKQDHLKDSKIVVPNLNEQHYIVQFLDKKTNQIDSIRNTIIKEIENLENYKKSVITEAVTKGLDKNVEMKDSGIEWIGEIPKHWKVVKGKYIFKQRNEKGNTINLEQLSPTQEYGVIPQALYEELSGMRAVKLSESTDLNLLKSIYKGDYCISLRSFQGGFEYSNYDGVVSPAYQVFYKKVDSYDSYYEFLFKERSFIEKMNSYTMSLRDGKNISFNDFGKTFIPYPDYNEQVIIGNFLKEFTKKINDTIKLKQKQLETLEEYKKTLIYEYVTGKKEVNDGEES